jgi:predicted aspartyl protease
MAISTRVFLLAALALGAFMPTAHAAEGCRLDTMGELNVIWQGPRALVDVGINGKPTLGLVDTGALTTALLADTARQLGLKLILSPGRFVGVGGSVRAYSARVEELTLGRWRTRNADLYVMDASIGPPGKVALLLGQDVLSAGEVEFDFANNVIKLYKPSGNCDRTQFAYWAQAFVSVDIRRRWDDNRHLRVDVELNGKRVTAMLDSGAPVSIVTRKTASQVGVDPGGPNATRFGEGAGLSDRRFDTWIANFDSFVLGGEAVRNARIRIADVDGWGVSDAGMILGMDFFRAHRIFVSYQQEKMYFTYNGGRIFDVTSPPPDPTEGLPELTPLTDPPPKPEGQPSSE